MRRFLSKLLHRIGDWLYDAVLPPIQRCDPQIFEKGHPVFYIAELPALAIEVMVSKVRADHGIRIDWSYLGGLACIKVLGSREDMAVAMESLHGMMSNWRELELPPTKERYV